MSEPIIKISELRKSFGKTIVLDGIDLAVERGTMLALLGPNGAGKTTIVKILSTLLLPDTGVAVVNGFNVVAQADGVRKSIGLTGQYAAVDEMLSGRENLVMVARLNHMSLAASKKRAEELLVQFDLVEAADKKSKNYSGGMRRRLDLAASLVGTPEIIFLDEPTTGLDPRSRIAMWQVIEDLKKQGSTILLTTQYLEEADKLADRIAVLDGGKIIALGTADELKSKVGMERIEIVAESAAGFEEAKSLLQTRGSVYSEAERSISLPTDGSVGAIKQVLDTLHNAHIEIDSMSVHKPTLDDVFLHLTGRETAEGENKTGGSNE